MSLAQKYIEIVRSRGERRLQLNRVYRMMCHRDLYLAAYGKLYANQGAMTPGTDPQDIVDGMSLKRIDEIISQLKGGTYCWKPVKRTYILKNNGQKRPLSQPSWSDKLVQEVIRMLLEAYYEPRFSKYSHGFRPGRGCHTALDEICQHWKGTKWFIEGDIKGCFDNIDSKVLLDISKREVQDYRFIKLLKEMLAAGYREDWEYHHTYAGVPQGGVVSPLLSNIVLNELDQFVAKELIPKYHRGQRKTNNPEHSRLTTQMMKARRTQNLTQYRRLEKLRRKMPSQITNDESYCRLKYIRYCDDFLLGFVGPKAEAEEVKRAIGEYLQTLHLTMSAEKTLITHATESRARFLGYEIYTAKADNRITTYEVIGQPQQVKRRAANGSIQLSVPRDVAQDWKGRHTRRGKPFHRAELLYHSDYEIVTTYNVEFQGLVNYYTLANDVAKKLYPVKRVYGMSLAKTLAAKHKRKTTWVFRNYRQKLDNGRSVIAVKIRREPPKAPLVAMFGAKPIQLDRNVVIKDAKTRAFNPKNELVTRLLAQQCELCHSTEKVEVHHIRKLTDIKNKHKGRSHPPEWTIFMMKRHRKTMVVCQKCHQAIHSGTYDGPKLN